MPRITIPILVCLFFLCSCMISEEVTSVYIANNGSIEMVRFLDNVRSDKDGPEGIQEQNEWLADFRRNEISEIKSLKEAGATQIKVTLLKDRAPFSAVIRASFSSVNKFGKVFGLNTKKSKNKVIFKKRGESDGVWSLKYTLVNRMTLMTLRIVLKKNPKIRPMRSIQLSSLFLKAE